MGFWTWLRARAAPHPAPPRKDRKDRKREDEEEEEIQELIAIDII